MASGVYTITGTVATPTFSPAPGIYTAAQNVTMSCTTTGATIRYTINGSDPTESSTVYSSPLVIATTTTLKAKAFKTDWAPSSVASGVYTITIITPENLVAHWGFEEGSGTTAIDQTGHGNNGTISGNPIWGTEGINGKALIFDGVDDYISMGTTANLQPSNITIEGWFNCTSIVGSSPHLAGNSKDFCGYNLYIPSDVKKWAFMTQSGGVFYNVGGNEISFGKWYHVAGTYDGSNSKIYINGILAGSIIASMYPTTHHSFVVGDHTNPGSYQYNGIMDELRVYSVALSASEIEQIYNSGLNKEIVTKPGTVSGETNPELGTNYVYSTIGAHSNFGEHTVEYSFDWGDGTSSPWDTSRTAQHNWPSAGSRTITVMARCRIHTNKASTSDGLIINVQAPAILLSGMVTDGISSIINAHVEVWSSYPDGTMSVEVQSDGTGTYSFLTIAPGNYDIRAYKNGFYPTVIQDITCPSSGNTITLESCPSVVTSSTNCDFWGTASYLNSQLFRTGDVVKAMDPNNIICGICQVTSEGAYNIHVYGDDPTTSSADEGAVSGDRIRFDINKTKARVKTGTDVWENLGSLHTELEAPAQGRNIFLYPNWNLISFNVIPSDSTLLGLISPLSDKISNICAYIAGSGFKTYDKNRPAFLNDLISMNYRQGYWVKVSSTQNELFEVAGTLCDAGRSISLLTNWNLVSYIPEEGDSLSHALASLGSNYLYVSGYEGGSAGGFRTWDRNRPSFLNDLQILKPTHGYWIKMSAPGILNYPTNGYQAPGVLSKTDMIIADILSNPVVYTRYYCDIWCVDEVNLNPRDHISVMDPSGLVCGTAIVQDQFGFLVHVYGDDPETEIDEGAAEGEQLTLSINGILVRTEENILWQDRGSVQIHLSSQLSENVMPKEYKLFQNYPNPFNPETTIRYELPKAGRITLSIFNIKGEKIKLMIDEEKQVGSYSIIWNGTDEMGNLVSSGIYLVVLTTETGKWVNRLTYLK